MDHKSRVNRLRLIFGRWGAIALGSLLGLLLCPPPTLAQFWPTGTDPQQTAIQMLEENPEQVLNLVRLLLQANPGIVQQIQQNPGLVQQALSDYSALADYLQQNPAILNQLQQILQDEGFQE
jgi:hypothetical protein